MALQALAPQLSALGEASAHPRDVANAPAFREAVAVLASSNQPITLATELVVGANWMLSAAALAALAERSDRQGAASFVARQFRHLRPWPIFYAARYFLTLEERPATGALIVGAPEYWAEHPLVPMMLAEHLSARTALGDEPSFGDALPQAKPEEVSAAETLLRTIHHPHAEALRQQLAAWRRASVDRQFLQSIGRFVERDRDRDLHLEHAAIRQPLAAAEAAVLTAPFRSAVVVGEPRCGKTAFVMLLVSRAIERGWTVFEAGAASLLSGQQYFGQLEERVSRLIAELAIEKRVIWFVPDLLQLALSGVHTSHTASLLEQVLPAISAGRLVMVSETTPAALTAVQDRFPALQSLFELVRLRALSDAECDDVARQLAGRVQALHGIEIGGEVTDTVVKLARHYLGTGRQPGAGLDLLKLAAQRAIANGATAMNREHVVGTLSQLTGMPALVLDSREPLNLADIRSFFTRRVIGQEEAVDAVIDRVAMLKAGLTDPSRPIGVFLLAGPTGTGKTELAKTLAEFLFGSADRLIRLDMSEFQTVESTRKILGDAQFREREANALTDRVAKQPFSVVLLDEFEKAHPNAWDLFLQVFDDGRLTDVAGRTVDFRHTIVVLTSNLGSTIQQHASPGFADVAGSFAAGQVLRAVAQTFRPEFVNRLDAVIVFRPFTRALMRTILLKELAAVLERRGLRDREWAVEWESSALDFLLEKGFSAALGARPLKRAIDRYLLAPLAATLVEHRAPEGDQFLFVRSDGHAIQVEFVDPDAAIEPAARLEPAAAPAAASGRLTLAQMILHPAGEPDEAAALTAEMRRAESRLADDAWYAVEQALVSEMQRPDFWTREDRFGILARYALLDRVRAAMHTATALESRLTRSAAGSRPLSRDLVGRLALQLHVVRHGVEDVFDESPVEVVLAVQPVLDRAPEAPVSRRWALQVFDMYRRWASRRHMQWDELQVADGTRMAIVSGFGAARILGREAGLHALDYESGRESLSRVVGRVRVAATPPSLPDAPPERLRILTTLIEQPTPTPPVVRRYRLDGAPLVRDVAGGWRTGRPELVLGGDFDLVGDVLMPSAEPR
ncbi:MAG TPA: AAA family ATPase [Vicinamibacterales bacterium]|nr:AAA family ATPase [Vicinamibacterales bacterium]